LHDGTSRKSTVIAKLFLHYIDSEKCVIKENVTIFAIRDKINAKRGLRGAG